MKESWILYKRCRKSRGAKFTVPFLLATVFYGMSWILGATASGFILDELLHAQRASVILVILAALIASGVLSSYFKSLLGNEVFCFRLDEIAQAQKACIRVPAAEAETEEGQERIEEAMSAVASGNDYGIEAYLSAAIELLMIVFSLALYVLMMSRVPAWLYLFSAASIAVILPYEVWYQRREERKAQQNREDRINLETFRRCTLQDDYAKDERLFDGLRYTEDELEERIQPVVRFAKTRRNERIASRGVTKSVILAKNILFAGIAAQSLQSLEAGDIALYIGLLSGVDALAAELAEKLCEMLENRVITKRYLDFMEKAEETEWDSSTCSEPLSEPVRVLEMKHVSFSYGDRAVFKDLSFTLHKGEKIAVVGENGAGKTTLIKLVLGVLAPDGGSVSVNGTDISGLNRNSWWDHISAALQDSPLLAFRVDENISCRTPEETDRGRLYEVMGKTGIDRKVESLKEKEKSYCTNEFGGDGVDFSGGERQKLFMARMLYKDADLVLLDEPTASLDPKAEKEVYEMAAGLTADKLCIFVSHRLGSCRFCDRILYIAGCDRVECGTFEELYESNESFRLMYDSQKNYYRMEGGEEPA